MTTTTKGTIKYKISFEKTSMTKGAAESNANEKNSSYYLLPVQTFHLTFTKKTEIFGMSTQFKMSMKYLHYF